MWTASAESVEFQGVTLEYTDAKVLWPSGAEGEGDIVFVYTNAVGSLTLPGSAVGRILAVGGGGAGSATSDEETKAKNVGGGGGAGGKFVDKNVALNGGTYAIVLGAGGTAAGAAGGESSVKLGETEICVVAGGAGGDTFGNGGDGGAGSKGGGPNTDYDALVFGGAGGSGKECDITGETLYYAAGGGGAVLVGNNRGLGGSGIGGNGAFGPNGQNPATDGVRGSGGGGGSNANTYGKGGNGVVIIRLSAVVGEPLDRPSTLQPEDGYYYNGESQNAIQPSDGYEISGGRNEIGVGSYTTTATLKPGFKWTDGTDTDDTVKWEIKKAKNRIDNLVLKGWKIGEEANSPTCRPLWPKGEGFSVTYTYSKDKENWSREEPESAGLWFVKATIPEGNNWEGAEAVADFYLWDDASAKNFSDCVTITLPEGVGELFKFTLAENNPLGFNHVRAKDGFFVLDASGQMLDYEIESWNVEGVSTIKLSAPGAKAGDVITIYWKSDDGKTPPPTKLGEVGDPTEVEFSLVTRNRLKVNYFVESPTIDRVRWELQSPPSSLNINKGRLAEGDVKYYFYYATTPDVHFTDYRQMTRAGTYIAAFVPEATDEYEQLVHTIEINVIGHTAYTSLGSSAEGRALLMNNDCREGSRSAPAINYQGWYDADNAGAKKETPTYWHHDNPDEAISLYNLRPGANSTLYAYDGDGKRRELWRLKDIRHGNTFPRDSDTAPLAIDQNYLPYDAENSLRISEHSTRAVRRRDVGQIVMRNVLDASITSPCYTNGLGTIYFDAVNGWTNPEFDDTNSYQIVVEAVLGSEAEFVTDESDLWQPLKMRPVRIVDGKIDEELPEREILDLDITNGGTMKNFYRVYVPVGEYGKARFRIRRVSIDAERAANPDGKALILLDNVLASYPAMGVELKPTGEFDYTRSGKSILGYAGSFIPQYPAATDEIIAKAKPVYHTAGGISADVSAFVSTARMHYRWRYLNQATNDWQTVFLNPDDDFKSTEPLALPNEVGDVEFYFSADIQAPYYNYVDYTGLNLGFSDYTEEIGAVTNRAEVAENVYPTKGTDWFVRLREGKSDYEWIRVLTRKGEGSPETTTELAVANDHQWRGYVRTTEQIAEGLEFRLEAVRWNPEIADFEAYRWKADYDLPDLVAVKSAPLVPGGVTEWSKVECTAATGHLLFIVDEEGKSLTVTRADYQNFNGWNDANKQEEIFVGHSETEGRSGVSHGMKSFEDEFSARIPCVADSDYWRESFAEEIGDVGWPGYEPFITARTPNGWTANQGMWVHEKFKDTGMAFQMDGQGKGSLEFRTAAVSPRGLGEVSFAARVAQSILFNNIAYDYAPNYTEQTKYTFVTQMAMSDFDWKSSVNKDDFDGAGQLSVVANYRPVTGCYEFRITRRRDNTIAYELFKWVYKNGTCKAISLSNGARELSFAYSTNVPFKKYDNQYAAMYISVDRQSDGSVKIQAGVSRGRQAFSVDSVPDGNWINVCYWDGDNPLGKGTFGVASANCPAIFKSPRVYNSSVTWLNPSLGKNHFSAHDDAAVTFNGSSKSEKDNLIAGYWALADGCYHVNDVDRNWGITADCIPQPISVQWSPVDRSEWTTITNVEVSTFVKSKRITVPLYIRQNAALRLSHGGSIDDAKTDVVLDDVEFTQWLGEDYTEDSSFKAADDGSPTNFVFTSAWVHEATDESGNSTRSIELSPMRTATKNAVASIRSPLMDGFEGSPTKIPRGKGLGMFAFAYTNANVNAKLILQVATNNVQALNLPSLTKESANSVNWTNVAEFVFADLPKNGVCSHYLGMHDVVGVMRLVVAPETIAAANEMTEFDPEFGQVFITRVFCRDEPAVDTSCWWGWNLRTSADLRSEGDAKLMYLSDFAAGGGSLGDSGMSVALNNSVYSDTIYEEEAAYKEHQPFVQTPTFSDAEVGEVSFKARRYDVTKGETARITVYGAANGALGDDSQWEYVTHFDITDNLYHTYTYRTDPNQNYRSLRFMVVGVKDAKEIGDADDPRPDSPVRVAFDEVMVCEAVRPTLAFREIFAFRSDLDGLNYSDKYDHPEEQPLFGECWGVQTEVYAAQLPDEVDFKRGVKVKLYWYDGVEPWGFDNWRAKAKSAYLTECEDKPLFFRSSYSGDPESVVRPNERQEEGLPVQYMLEAEYYTKESDSVVRTLLKKGNWIKPRWYAGVDYNEQFRSYGSFAAYTILDSVSPGWAWINEVNIFGGYQNWNNKDQDYQFVEVAIPREASIADWKVQFISQHGITNTACRFVKLADPSKSLAAGQAPASKSTHEDSSCVFLSVAGPKSKTSILESGYDVDGVWNLVENDLTFTRDQRIAADDQPLAIRLVRKSGVIEHEIVLEGTNIFTGTSYEYDYSAERAVKLLNEAEAEGKWFDAGDDSLDGDHSLSVLAANGGVAANWSNTPKRTPGFKNEGQTIDPNHPTPIGSTILVYARLDQDPGHFTQSDGTSESTVETLMMVVPRNSETGTNIVYRVEPWYELDSVIANGVPLELPAMRRGTVKVPVGRNASGDVTVVAKTRFDSRLDEYVEPDDPYRPAIVDWLNRGTNAYGDKFETDDEDSRIYIAELIRKKDDSKCRDLTLTEMYWLDINPFQAGWALKAGFAKCPFPIPVGEVDDDPIGDVLTNVSFSVYMCITNRSEKAAPRAPYVLRSLDPGKTSWDYIAGEISVWTSVTFKATGYLANGLPYNIGSIPLRWFVFDEGSFYPAGHEKEFQSMIEIIDPYSRYSPGWSENWGVWRGKAPVWHGFNINTKLGPYGIGTLKPENPVYVPENSEKSDKSE